MFWLSSAQCFATLARTLVELFRCTLSHTILTLLRSFSSFAPQCCPSKILSDIELTLFLHSLLSRTLLRRPRTAHPFVRLSNVFSRFPYPQRMLQTSTHTTRIGYPLSITSHSHRLGSNPPLASPLLVHITNRHSPIIMLTASVSTISVTRPSGTLHTTRLPHRENILQNDSELANSSWQNDIYGFESGGKVQDWEEDRKWFFR